MSTNQDNSSTQAPPPTQGPKLCKMGCGFFGSDATGECCSKCFMDALKKNADKCLPATATPAAAASSPLPTPVEVEVQQEEAQQEAEPMEVDTPAPKPVKKKKKKKQSYKSMMNSMMAGDKGRDVKQEQREKIGSGVGGGAFSKIEKI
mmetsp:Transcript_45873/g.111146  ORF Transcript_45873/g.111146 Transcript_45873/m.111146 type:complete len:148 (+) Transcript_45873:165-608(+)